MKRYFFTKIVLLVIYAALILLSQQSFAQRVRASASLGVSAYLGDLIQGAPVFKEVSPALSLGGTYDITDQFRARLNLSILGIRGDDKLNSRFDYRQRNLNFKSTIWEVAFLGEYDLLNSGEYSIVPYVFGGPGVFHFNPKTIDKDGVSVNLHDVGTEGQLLGNPDYAERKYSLTKLNLQLGIGVRYEVNEIFTLGIETSFRKTFTDYLDDVSNTVPVEFDPAINNSYSSQLSFRSGELGYSYDEIKYHPRGNPKRDDLYYTLQVRATFRLDGIHLGRDLDFYSSGSYRAKRSTKNPKNLF